MNIEFVKTHDKAVTPTRANNDDAGMDFTAVSEWHDAQNDCWVYDTGIAVSIPQGFVGLLFQRSSVYKTDMSLCNAVGVLDPGFFGNILFKFNKLGKKKKTYNVGDRIGQLVVVPFVKVELTEVLELGQSERGTSGWGSSGA